MSSSDFLRIEDLARGLGESGGSATRTSKAEEVELEVTEAEDEHRVPTVPLQKKMEADTVVFDDGAKPVDSATHDDGR